VVNTGLLRAMGTSSSVNTSSTSTTSRGLSIVSKAIVPILLAVAVNHFLFTGLEAPPSDYGSGSMFDMISGRYDRINRILSMGMDIGWRRRMVQITRQSVADTPQPRLLDVATGTADVALLLRQEIPTATVLGVDPSSNMLKVGRDKIQKAGLDAYISLELANAQDLAALTPSSYDAATMAFGIRNVPDRKKALCQIHTVLKDKARFCILEFSEPDDSFGFLGAGARLFIRYVIPMLGGILSGAPREYWHLQNSIKDFPTPLVFVQQIESLVCNVVGVDDATASGDETSNLGSGTKRRGGFRLEELIQMSFGSVQLYVIAVVK
jgi:demethylmenaquinone methyltransferase / 2-methoxy-6-polyprenyl-1,4-benzoquinol methylase